MRFLGLALVAFAFVNVGCGSDRNPSSTADMGVLIDLGTAPADSGNAMDEGTGDDAGPVLTDAGRDLGLPPGCEPPAPEAPTAVQCTSTTYSCVADCTTAECQQTCVQADDFTGDGNPDTNCVTCVSQASISCAYTQGCDDEYDIAQCCIAVACAETPTAECAASACPAEQNAFISCANTALMARPACAQDAIACFPAAG